MILPQFPYKFKRTHFRTNEQKMFIWTKAKIFIVCHNFQISSNEHILEQMNKKMFIWTKVKIFIICHNFQISSNFFCRSDFFRTISFPSTLSLPWIWEAGKLWLYVFSEINSPCENIIAKEGLLNPKNIITQNFKYELTTVYLLRKLCPWAGFIDKMNLYYVS